MAIVERLAKHVADFGVLYTKIHNYHWHVGGLNFLVIHQMTDGYYERRMWDSNPRTLLHA